MRVINQCTECNKFKKWDELQVKYYSFNTSDLEPNYDLICDNCYPEYYDLWKTAIYNGDKKSNVNFRNDR